MSDRPAEITRSISPQLPLTGQSRAGPRVALAGGRSRKATWAGSGEFLSLSPCLSLSLWFLGPSLQRGGLQSPETFIEHLLCAGPFPWDLRTPHLSGRTYSPHLIDEKTEASEVK